MHASRTVSNCFAVLRQIRSIRRSLTRPVLQSLVVSLVMSRLHYSDATVVGLPDNQLSWLQSVPNDTARLVFSARKYQAVSPLLRDLHWLLVPQRIEFKQAVLSAHVPLSEFDGSAISRRVADIDSRQCLRSASTSTLVVPPCTPLLAIAHFRLRLLAWNSLPCI